MLPAIIGLASLGAGLAWEGGWIAARKAKAYAVFQKARFRAQQLNLSLLVLSKDSRVDITKPLPFANNSVVVFCDCVLENVPNPFASMQEIARVSGGEAFFVGIQPWTLAGNRSLRTLPPHLR